MIIMDAELISQVVNVVLTLGLAYGLIYFKQYRPLFQRVDKLASTVRRVMDDKVVTPGEIDEVWSELEGLKVELDKLQKPTA
jgi:hypothetical protein